jgi:hypothetical protein
MSTPPGPAPKSNSQRRRRNVPKSYGSATPATAPAAATDVARELGIDDVHPLITAMWDAVQISCEATFFSEADWARARWELWFADSAMRSGRPLSGQTWAVVQHGLTELLISPAAKRRAAIEVKPAGVDADAVAAVSMVGRYRQALKSV